LPRAGAKAAKATEAAYAARGVNVSVAAGRAAHLRLKRAPRRAVPLAPGAGPD